MSAAWLVYALATGALVALTARALETAARTLRWPTRWINLTSLLATLVLIGRAARERVGDAAVLAVADGVAAGPVVAPAPGSPLLTMLHAIRAAVDAQSAAGVARAARWLPGWVPQAAGAAWIVAATAALLILALVHLRLRRARLRWPTAELHGRRVRVAPTVGPAVIGLVRPEIVVPQWLFDREADEQRLVLAHEDAHVAARDHLVLTAGCLAVALMPWHPAAWWSLARLRLAIELDCDARVLRRGVAPRRYGEMLIDLAGQCSGFRVGATALADKTSHLERRLLAMRPITTRFALARAGALSAAAALSLAAACEARVPTSAEVQGMDATSAKSTAERLGLLDAMHGAAPLFYVDGAPVTAAEAHAIPARYIATVDLQKPASPGDPATIRIRTVAAGRGGSSYRTADPNAAAGIDGESGLKSLHEKLSGPEHSFDGLILIDGVRADASALHKLDPKNIAGVEIIKGAAATERSSDPAAKNGIISVRTKAARTAG
jgi:beta-lactamase regulating signal transducer with metallopeptidase domain